MSSQPQNMHETARIRGKRENQSVTWERLVPNIVIYGRPRYWRMVDTTIPLGTKAGGFVKSAKVKALLDARYAGDITVSNRDAIRSQLESEDFMKETVS